MLTAILVRPVLAALTILGIIVNHVRPHALQRARLDVIDKPLRVVPALPGTDVVPIALPRCRAEWVVAPAAADSDRVIVYFHGSALVTLGLNSHRRFVSNLSQRSGARVFNVAYRLAPQFAVDDAVSDGLDAYRHVLALGISANHVVLAGDSAGGLFATKTALAARDAGLPAPAGHVLMSPLTSSDMSLKHRAAKTHRDAMFPFIAVKFIYEVFGTVNGTRPIPLMPPEADLHGLGPFLIQVGSDEMLLYDAFALSQRLQDHEVPTWVQVWDKAMHGFQLAFDVSPDARRAVDEVASFIRCVTTTHEEASA